MSEELPKYLENPEKYCERINTLLQQNSNEWQTVWKAAIPEISNLQANEISMINCLLKPVESAFKSKDSTLRVQAFECWSYFIVHCEKVKVSDKLWNVLLIPLLAHNHSVYIVLSAKIKTWHTFVETNFITKPNIMKKAIPSILKCLYGPHSLDTACKFAALSESCGQLYHKIMVKCAPFDETIDTIFSYLEKAIPPLSALSNVENTQKVAKLIWSDALRIISEKEWPKNHFTYLMRTFENLISDSKNDEVQLISNLLSILVNIYGSFPSDRLTPHMNLIIRCLFHPPVNAKVVSTIMNSILKICEKPSFFFHQLDVVLISTAESNKTDIDTLWITVASCYKKWVKNNRINETDLPNHDYSTACKILLFPLERMCELGDDTEKFNLIMKTWKSCYEECATSAATHCDKFLQSLTEKIHAQIEKASKQETNLIPTLKVAVSFCNTILMLIKFSDGFSHVKPVLHKISENVPHLKKLSDSDLKSFAVKYVVTVLSYVKLFPAHSEDFSYIIKTFGHLVPNEVEEPTQKSVENKSDEDSDSSGKLSNGVNRLSTLVTPLSKAKLRTSFLERLSPVGRKSDVVEPQVRSQTTPKASKIDDNDVQFVEIKSKPKNSPMTAHQQEIAKSKRYIPALYQDLSQSQSQSQAESVSILSENKKSNDKITPELFEENANLPSVTSVQDCSDIVPSSLSFRTGLTASAEKSSTFSSKKSLQFGEKKHCSEEPEDSIDITLQKKLSENDNENLPPIVELNEDQNKEDEKPSNKRRNSKAVDPPAEVTPIKRSKRLSTRLEGTIVTKIGPKSRTTPKEGTRKRKSSVTIDDPAGKEDSDVEVICVIDDTESQNVFVPTSASKKTGNVSSPLNSLMNVKDQETTGKKRKSLRARKSTTPMRSPIPTRNRRSSAIAAESVFNSKKSLFADSIEDLRCAAGDGNKDVKCAAGDGNKDAKCGGNVKVIVSDMHLPSGKKFIIGKNDDGKVSVTEVSEKELSDETSTESASNGEKKTTEDEAIAENKQEAKSSPNRSVDSVIIVEEPQSEVISIDDSECQTVEIKATIEPFTTPKPIKDDVSDESTFFDGSEDTAKNAPNEETNNAPINKGVSVIRSTNQAESATVSPEILTSCDVNTSAVISDTSPVCGNSEDDAVSSVSILENASTSASNESVSILDASSDNSKATEQNPDDSNSKTNDPDKDTDQSDKDVGGNRNNNVTISPIHGNSRTSQMLKLAWSSVPNTQPSEPTKTYSKPTKPAKSQTTQISSVRHPNRWISRIFKNLPLDNESTTVTPPKIITTTPSAEKLRYTPKECTSPGILKKPDASQNISSPKSSKFVNFADNLTHTKEFYVDYDDDDNMDSLISTGDKSNNNLINEDLKSQEILYSPLRNCRDDVKHVIEFIFSSSCSKTALEHFLRMGVNTVGQLAGMSTITANSIPAGDNRVQRLRQALKKYDDTISLQYESKGLRRPSARRRILKATPEIDNKLDVSSIMDLLGPGEINEKTEATNERTKDNENENIPKTSSPEIISVEPTGDTNEEPETDVVSPVAESEVASSVTEPRTDQAPEPADVPISESTVSVLESSDAPAVTEPVEVSPSLESSIAEQSPVEDVLEELSKIDEHQERIEPVKSVETEPVPERIENKENVDPSVTSVIIEPSQTPVDEPMDVDKIQNEKVDESANESLDYVCTDNGNLYNQDSSDRRSIVMKNIHRYSTVAELQDDRQMVSEERVQKETQVSPEIIVSVDDTETEIVEECKDESDVIVESPTSRSIIEQSAPRQETVEINEKIDTEQNQPLFETHQPVQSEQVNVRQDMDAIAERHGVNWNCLITRIYPYFIGDRDQAKANFMAVVKACNETLREAKLEMVFDQKD